MSEPLVDLLLVRLGGDEEKKKVTRLLVTELDMTVGEAEKAVDNSPVVIRDSVAIGEARIIQKNLYPYVDLLPRLEDDQAATLKEKVQFVTPPEDPDDFNVDDDDVTAPAADGAGEDGGEDEEEEEDFLLTTASDEMLQIERCHICGKTPVGGERLAPCRTCGDLTCRECFDRAAHVCHKCAAEGHSVDRPVAAKPQTKRHGSHSAAPGAQPRQTREGKGSRSKALFAVLILVLLVLFYFLDPLGLFKTEQGPAPVAVTHADSTVTDVLPDSLETHPDTSQAVTAPVQDPIGVLALSLPDSLLSNRQQAPVETYTRIPGSVSATSASEELAAIIPQIEALAGLSGLTIDRAALLVYGDRTKSDHLSVLVIAVNHPENNETRFSFLSKAAEWLTPGGIDQLVLFYRETRFHQPQVFTYTRQVFPQLSLAFSPSEFMDLATTHDALWASLSGPVMEWICEI